MQLLWERDGSSRVLASQVDTADSLPRQMLGLMFRWSIPEDYALVFRFDDVGSRDVHMLFVPFPLDVLWLVDGRVERKERLSPWTGLAKEEADMLVELPAGAASEVSVGDSVRIIESGAREEGGSDDESATDTSADDVDEWW